MNNKFDNQIKWINTLKEKSTKAYPRRNRTDVNLNYCCDHFAVYTSIKSLCSIPETNNVRGQLYIR